MQFAKIRHSSGATLAVLIENGQAFAINLARDPAVRSLADLLAQPEPLTLARKLIYTAIAPEPVQSLDFLAPIDRQEIWAAGVTYKRSKIAREEESEGAASFYDKVYTAARPELFMKATAERVINPNGKIRVRADSKWNVPEPEFTLVVSPDLRIVGYTVGNDVSSRDIEGENPLYLPQAKVYRGSCAIGPVITPVSGLPKLADVEIKLVIRRGGSVAFEGSTTLAMMARTPEDLVQWLGKEIDFPNGVLLLTGTGIVPPDSFNLSSGDQVDISISGIGTLTNVVE